MSIWFAETTLVGMALAAIAVIVGNRPGLRPGAWHALWLVVLIKLVTPPVVSWPWSPRLLPSSIGAAVASRGGPGAASVEMFPDLRFRRHFDFAVLGF